MPGTCGTLVGVLIHVVWVKITPEAFHLPGLTGFFVLVCLLNHHLTPWAETYWKSRDPSQFVLDEVAGYLIIPILFRGGELWKVVVWGFLMFRLFDIFKLIPPARQIDRYWHGPWGILLDDIVSGAYAAGFLYLINWLAPASWLK